MTLTRRLSAAVAAVCLGLTLAACGGGTTSASTELCAEGKIRFGIEPYEDPQRLKPAYEIVGAAMEKALKCKVEMTVVEDYAAEVLAMKNKKLDVAQFGPLGYVFAHEKAGAEIVGTFADAQGKPSTYTAGIWVPKTSSVKTVADLKGKSLALGSPTSASGTMFPKAALRTAGLQDQDVKIDYSGHSEALLALTNGKVEAAEINSQTLLTAKESGKFDPANFKQIWTSDPIPNDPVTVRSTLDPKAKDAIRKALLELSKDDVAKVSKLLGVVPSGGMVAVEKSHYQPMFDLAKTLGLTEKDAK
ncbi:phosphate/phosphite/phosphonate ABC transporter substrate-binding protein [Pseudonocardiaceae bacterium YIM PH 21723]|nr:phosphate/phosphite/phosphonate ABC transporter substrate-binding protein [Pseudonocardiaceae bacterium YIM PH 21723]